ncbi:DUF4411 family protein [Acidovorax sp. MR-S7]|uniref:DUF4411 family protein n=1 Tax=Acidovorax sp. MR-S7 TaxID=1268622 RepID=UPI00036AF1A5|nr:DUF4411 family protein [Acidovorax sp. MR-S7]GAD22284.1 hypothetical protein AVS7_02044 [Acidovorax sp. MR-S7]
MSYLLDANVFMAAKNLHYGLDFCPAFWDWLVHQVNTGAVFSIDKVADEIAAGADELSAWASDRGDGLFRRTHAALAAQFGQVSAWATGQHYTPAAINTFLQAADFYLVAHALAGGHVLVTNETPATSPGRIKIPNACVGLGVRFMTPYQMLRIERARFVLGAAA